MRPFPLLLSSLILLAACPASRAQGTEHGLLGVYGDRAQGRRTASGEVYRAEAATAAHATLPLGTVVRVANFDSGRMRDVRVNDRKAHDGRMLTVSHAAARALRLPANQTGRGAYMILSKPDRQRSVERSRGRSPEPLSTTADRGSSEPTERIRRPAVPDVPAAANASSGRGRAGATERGQPVATGAAARGATSSSTRGGGPFQDFKREEGLLDRLFSDDEEHGYRAGAAANDRFAAAGARAPASDAGAPRDLVPMNAGNRATRSRRPFPPPSRQEARTAASGRAARSAPPAPSATVTAPYRAQFGAFRKLRNAAELRDDLERAGVATSIVQSRANDLFLVVTRSGFSTAEDAQRWIDYEAARRRWRERPVVVR